MSTTKISTGFDVRAGIYDIDPIHSRIGFAVRHLGINLVRGRFTRFEGTLEVPSDLAGLKVAGSVEAASVDTAFAQRDEHLRTADFFDVENTPDITFTSDGLARTDEQHSQIDGEITIRGVTRPLTLDVELGGIAVDQYGQERLGLMATGHLSRADFGMPYNQLLGRVAVVADRIDLSLDIEAVWRPDAG